MNDSLSCLKLCTASAAVETTTDHTTMNSGDIMSARSIPNLRRDLPISALLLVMAIAALLPGRIAATIAVAGIMGLMVFRLIIGRPSPNTRAERSPNERSRADITQRDRSDGYDSYRTTTGHIPGR